MRQQALLRKMTICVADFFHLLTAEFATCKCTNESNLVPMKVPALSKHKGQLHFSVWHRLAWSVGDGFLLEQ